jgi:glycosyltransferase involved in cell wall biosynthesis
MRILVISNLYPPAVRGGYELECAEVVERLSEHHEVTVLTSSADAHLAPPQPNVLRSLDLVRSGARGTVPAPLSALRGVRIMRRTLAEVQPELAFVWNGAQLPHSALRVLADSGTPIAVRVCQHWFGIIFDDDQFMRYLRPGRRGAHGLWGMLMRQVNRLPALRLQIDRPFAVALSWNSQTVRTQTGLPPMVRPVLERVIHPTTRRVEELLKLQPEPQDPPEIAFLGRLEEFKGPDVAIRALALLRDEHGLRATLTLAGHGRATDHERLRALAAREGLSEAVALVGPLERPGVEALLSRASALVVPSVWEEPFGMVAVEGAAAGVPVVASDVGGISEGLHDGEHALLFARGDAGGCARALASTLTDREQTRARVQRARERARDFLLEPYLDASEQFVLDAARALETEAGALETTLAGDG